MACPVMTPLLRRAASTISNCTSSAASCTSRPSCRGPSPSHEADSSCWNLVPHGPSAGRESWAYYLLLLRRAARLRPAAAILPIRFLPYFRCPAAAATAAGLRAPLAAARRLILAKRPPPPSLMDFRRLGRDFLVRLLRVLRLAILPPLSEPVS